MVRYPEHPHLLQDNLLHRQPNWLVPMLHLAPLSPWLGRTAQAKDTWNGVVLIKMLAGGLFGGMGGLSLNGVLSPRIVRNAVLSWAALIGLALIYKNLAQVISHCIRNVSSANARSREHPYYSRGGCRVRARRCSTPSSRTPP